MEPSVETVVGNIVLSREICNHGSIFQGSHLVQSLLDPFLGLRICVGHIASDDGCGSMMWAGGWVQNIFALRWYFH
jgi:hypothetical protein